MAIAIEFQGHENFHKAFARMAIAAGGAGVLAELVHGLVGSRSLAVGASWPMAVIGVAAVLAAVWPRIRQLRALSRGVLVAALATSGVLVSASTVGSPAVIIGAALLGGFVSVWGLRGRALAIGTLAAGAVLVIAAAVSSRIAAAELFMTWPTVATSIVAGLGFACVAALTQLPRHVLVVRDVVGAAHRKLAPRTDGELRELCDRGHELWRKAESSLAVGDTHRDLLEEGVLRLYDVADRWVAVDAESAHVGSEALTARIDELDARIEAASDEVVRAQYRAARTALGEQLRYVDDIGASRDRVLARMHNYLAAMERLNLALVNVKSTSASKSAVDVQPMVESLADLGRDIDALGDALDG